MEFDPTQQAEPDPTGLVVRALEALERGDYVIAAGFAIMAITFVLIRIAPTRRYVPRELVATLLVAVAVVAGVAFALFNGGSAVRTATASATCAAVAIATWEALAKHLYELLRRRRRRGFFDRKFPMG